MKTAVIYTSKYGTTYSIAKHISLALNADLFTINEFHPEKLSGYDAIVLGTPIYGGKSYGEMDLFCRDYQDQLMSTKLALFVSGLAQQSHKKHRELKRAYLKPLAKHAVCIAFVGGAINFDKLSTNDKRVADRFLKTNDNVTDIDQEAIEQLIAAIKTENPTASAALRQSHQ